MPRAPLHAGGTGGKPAPSALPRCHEGKGGRGEGGSRGTPWLKGSFPKGKIGERSLSSHILGIGTQRGETLLPHAIAKPGGSSRSPQPQTRAQIQAHTHGHRRRRPSPRPGPPMHAGTRPKAGTTPRRRSSGPGKRGPCTHRRSPHGHGHRGCAPALAAPRLLPANTGCCSAPAPAPAPARLPRASLAAALCSRPAPARGQRRLLPARRRPSSFIRATWPLAWKAPFASPEKGGEAFMRGAEATGRSVVGGPPGSDREACPPGM